MLAATWPTLLAVDPRDGHPAALRVDLDRNPLRDVEGHRVGVAEVEDDRRPFDSAR